MNLNFDSIDEYYNNNTINPYYSNNIEYFEVDSDQNEINNYEENNDEEEYINEEEDNKEDNIKNKFKDFGNYKCGYPFKVKGKLIKSKKIAKNKDSDKMWNTCVDECLKDDKCVAFGLNNKFTVCKTYSDVESITNNKSKTNFTCVKKINGTRCEVPLGTIPMPKTEEELNYDNNNIKPKSDSNSNSNTKMTKGKNACALAQLDLLFDTITGYKEKKEEDLDEDLEETEEIDEIIYNNTNNNTNNNTINNTNNNKVIIESETQPIQQPQQILPEHSISKPQQKIYVDSDCFMKNMQNLKNNSNNFMLDLSLLTSNIKSCAYVAKNEPVPPMMSTINPTTNLVDQVISKIEIPKPSTIDLNKKEGFESMNNSTNTDIFDRLFSSDLLKLIVIIVIIYFLIFTKSDKKKNN